MITRIRIDGEARSAEHLQAEFDAFWSHAATLFGEQGGSLDWAHVVLEHCNGSVDVAVHGNWKGRSTYHPDTQKGDHQIFDPLSVPGAAR